MSTIKCTEHILVDYDQVLYLIDANGGLRSAKHIYRARKHEKTYRELQLKCADNVLTFDVTNSDPEYLDQYIHGLFCEKGMDYKKAQWNTYNGVEI